jgi:hypothetical protein
MRCDMDGDDYCSASGEGTSAYQWFVQYWVYIDSGFDFESGNIKIIRLHNNSHGSFRIQAPFQRTDLTVEGTDQGHGGEGYASCTEGGWVPVVSGVGNTVDQILGHGCAGTVYAGSVGWANYSSDVKDGEWHQMQFQYAEGSGSTGQCKWWFDGTLIFDHSDLTTGNYSRYPFVVGWYMSSGNGDGIIHIDDLYADDTWARVELCEGSTWANKGQCEIQPISSFGTTTEITFNQGAFDSEETAYLYFVDDSGDPSAGYEIEIGSSGSADTTAPTVTAFTIPETSDSTTISITTFTATDDTAVTGYCVNESATPPTSESCSGSGWEGSAQTSYTFSSQGEKTLYGWAKDEAGNVSDSLNDAITVTVAPRLTGVHGSFTY